MAVVPDSGSGVRVRGVPDAAKNDPTKLIRVALAAGTGVVIVGKTLK